MSYSLIAKTTVGSGGTMAISFTSIPQTYTDLVLLVTARNGVYNYGGFFMKLNGSAWLSDVDAKRLIGETTTTYSNNSEEMTWNNSSYTAGAFSNGQMYFSNYTGSGVKPVAFEGVQAHNGQGPVIHITSWIWNQTAPITQIEIGNFDNLFQNDRFVQNSTAYLYGIKS
jgi:hypothetical protein